jgi:hypothetical protein
MKNRITTFEELLVGKYGERGTIKREKWEKGFENFKTSVLEENQNERKKPKLSIFSNKRK